MLKPFWHYYGGKYKIAGRYPSPRHEIIIEPFAGAAGYSTRHHTHLVILVERNPRIAAIWRYLISADPARVLSLPDVGPGGVNAIDASEPERDLMALWCNPGGSVAEGARSMPRSTWAAAAHRGKFWDASIRERIAAQVPAIRHWRVIEGEWHDAPSSVATWFVDPPYNNVAGRKYKYNTVDFALLGLACRTAMPGQVIACENEGADWLPFRTLMEISGGHRRSVEVIWTNDP